MELLGEELGEERVEAVELGREGSGLLVSLGQRKMLSMTVLGIYTNVVQCSAV